MTFPKSHGNWAAKSNIRSGLPDLRAKGVMTRPLRRDMVSFHEHRIQAKRARSLHGCSSRPGSRDTGRHPRATRRHCKPGCTRRSRVPAELGLWILDGYYKEATGKRPREGRSTGLTKWCGFIFLLIKGRNSTALNENHAEIEGSSCQHCRSWIGSSYKLNTWLSLKELTCCQVKCLQELECCQASSTPWSGTA